VLFCTVELLIDVQRKRGNPESTARSKLKQFEQELLKDDFEKIRPEVEVKQIRSPGGEETYILCRTTGRKEKEKAIRSRFVAKMEKALAGLGKRIVEGKLKDRDKMLSCFKLRIHKWRKFCCHTEAPQFTLAMQKVGVCATGATSQPTIEASKLPHRRRLFIEIANRLCLCVFSDDTRQSRQMEPRCSRDVQIILRHLEEVGVESTVTSTVFAVGDKMHPNPRSGLASKIRKMGQGSLPQFS